MDLSSEDRRRQNIADNKRILAEIGLINPFKGTSKLVLKKSGLKRKANNELPRQKKRPLLEENIDHSNHGSVMGTRRKSARLQGVKPGEGSYFMQLEDDFDEEEVENNRVEKNRPNHYGAIPGVEVGASWYTRMECCRDGIHRPTVAGIHAGAEGAYSIALSGGYDDNVDYGECFTYTGEGGRDLKGTKANPKNLRTAPQSKNQTLTRGNLALSRNVETGNPVRVIRGYKLTSPFAPDEGYRYDGLYTVEKAWYTGGMSGFMVWKFALKRCKDQAPPPWEFAEDLKDADTEKAAEKSDEVDTEKCEVEDNQEQTEDNRETRKVEDNKENLKDAKDKDVLKESQTEKWIDTNQHNINEEVDNVKMKKNEEFEDDKNILTAEQVDEADETECKPEVNENPGNNIKDPEKQKNSSVDEQRNDFHKSNLKSTGNENHGKDSSEIETMDKVDGTDQLKIEDPKPAAAVGGEDERLCKEF